MLRLFVFALACLGLVVQAQAQPSHDRARQEVEAGRMVPLSSLLDRVQSQHGGRLIEAELEDEDGQSLYEIKWLGGDGKVSKFYFDARTGQLLKVHAKGARP